MKPSTIAACLLLTLGACSESREHDGLGDELSEEETRELMSPAGVPRMAGDKIPRAVRVAPISVANQTPVDAIDSPTMVHDEAAEATWIDTLDVLVIDGVTQETALLEIDGPDLALNARVAQEEDARLAPTAAALGMVEDDPAPASGTELITKGIQGDNDTRSRYGIKDGYGKKDWMATIGMLTPFKDKRVAGCTGTLIGPGLVITAAHCILDKNKELVPQGFVPRMDGTGSSEGREPWGHWTEALKYYVGNGYVANKCYATYTTSCPRYDFALIRYKQPASVTWPWSDFYMRIRTVEQGAMTYLKNRGYGDCKSPEPPPSCVSFTLYGDRMSCGLGLTSGGNDNGYSDAITHTCDANKGHSGSPMYIYVNGIPTIAGIHVSDGGSINEVLGEGNWMRRVTPGMETQIASFK